MGILFALVFSVFAAGCSRSALSDGSVTTDGPAIADDGAPVDAGDLTLDRDAGPPADLIASGDDSGLTDEPSKSVLRHHRNLSRNGLYADPAFTHASVATLHRLGNFAAAYDGPTYAQPLFLDGNGQSTDLLFVVTEPNGVYAFDANGGALVWTKHLGAAVARANLPCGNIDPLGITGTPVIDAAARTIYLAAMTTPDGGATKRQLVYALSTDDGALRPGWPVDISATAKFGPLGFDSAVQHQRGALALVGGVLYVPYGGHYGDCGAYHGWVVGIPVANPAGVIAWATRGMGGGVWAPGGVASDGKALFVATGNTMRVQTFSDGEAIIRLAPGPTFDKQPADYFAPSNWLALDVADIDLGGSGPVLFDLPGATPAHLIVALGKSGWAYLIDRDDLGGIGSQVASALVSSSEIINAAATYSTSRGRYVVFHGAGVGCPKGQTGDLMALRIGATAPPTIAVAWCAAGNGEGSPAVTTSDGSAEAIVWFIGAEGDGKLHGFDGDTGDILFAGGAKSDALGPVRRFQTPIVAKGRIYVAGDRALSAFSP